MIPDEIAPVIAGLLAKARAGQVSWMAAADANITSVGDNDFVVVFPAYAANVYRVPDSENAGFAVLNEHGKVIYNFNLAPHQDGYSDLEELLALAHRQVDRVDDALKSLREALETDGPVGQSRKLGPDDDLPF